MSPSLLSICRRPPRRRAGPASWSEHRIARRLAPWLAPRLAARLACVGGRGGRSEAAPPRRGAPRRLGGMSARRVMGIETEYGVSAPGDPAANAMLMSSQVVNAYAAPLGARARPGPLGLRGRGAAARRPRLRAQPGVRRPEPADRRAGRPGPGQRDPDQRRPAVRRPRPPGVLLAGGDDPARRGAVGQGGGAGHARRRRAGSAAAPGLPTGRTCTRTTPTARAPPTAPTRTT